MASQRATDTHVCVVTQPVWLLLQVWNCAALQRVCPVLHTGVAQVPLALQSAAEAQICVVSQPLRSALQT
jgi:hypothetical protein